MCTQEAQQERPDRVILFTRLFMSMLSIKETKRIFLHITLNSRAIFECHRSNYVSRKPHAPPTHREPVATGKGLVERMQSN